MTSVIGKLQMDAAKVLVVQRENAILEAIKFATTDDWNAEDFAARGQFIQQMDGTELFIFDGTPLLHFGHIHTRMYDDDGPLEIHFDQDITKIYERKKG